MAWLLEFPTDGANHARYTSPTVLVEYSQVILLVVSLRFQFRVFNSYVASSACREWYAMRISSFCSSGRARGLLRFNTVIVVSKELICKELGFSLDSLL